ncbi:hypothetical protein [Geothermobacter hydrogeniphilus]|uniref:Uncharacterized protein n=1 Tax=Geothermobacter hydrogeniphilus TaxID=1969733 RepID=A0A1X0XXP6_9BACT|nr:hypothetical protein [Geothermobacter hydrogeniphilus]ORJ57691.1 hypothetical protein B5V00_13045 [Geothermobacter hydrogeniphilus]
MKQLTTLLALVTTTLLLNACAPNATANLAMRNANRIAADAGSPFRMEKVAENDQGVIVRRTIIGTPGPTAADEVLAKDIAIRIKSMEQEKHQKIPLKLTEFRQVSAENGRFVEAWVFDRGQDTVVYMVSMIAAGDGVDFKVSGPWE